MGLAPMRARVNTVYEKKYSKNKKELYKPKSFFPIFFVLAGTNTKTRFI